MIFNRRFKVYENIEYGSKNGLWALKSHFLQYFDVGMYLGPISGKSIF